jgi:hypothetical protein
LRHSALARRQIDVVLLVLGKAFRRGQQRYKQTIHR